MGPGDMKGTVSVYWKIVRSLQ